MIASLYVHVPFCLKKCDYCDFFSVTTKETDQFPVYLEALKAEIQDKKTRLRISRWGTVYVGGGTPSLLQPAHLDYLGKILPKTEENTIEANPEDITAEWLHACTANGFNRISIGIQTLDDTSLSQIGRRGSKLRTLKSLELLQQYWNGRISVDLMTGLPGQTVQRLSHDIDVLVKQGISHFSVYSLTVEEGTPLARTIHTGKINLPDENTADSLWISARDQLIASGFCQYEVSNFALPGFESVHNLNYWESGNWIGAGPAASGTLRRGAEAVRETNTQDIQLWLEKPGQAHETEEITGIQHIQEYIMMGMRLLRGISIPAFSERFSSEIMDLIPRTIATWRAKGYLVHSEDRLFLTSDGILYLNRFLSDVIAELSDDEPGS